MLQRLAQHLESGITLMDMLRCGLVGQHAVPNSEYFPDQSRPVVLKAFLGSRRAHTLPTVGKK